MSKHRRFAATRSLAIDTQGSVYTSEVNSGKRAQRIVRVR
jgi:hypothetical protein